MKNTLFLLIPGILALLASCATTTIGQIQDNPQEFLATEVQLSGRVDKSITIPLTHFSVFLFDDGTGKAVVFSAQERKKAESFTLTAKVIALPAQETGDTAEKALNTISRFLVEKKLTSAENAGTVSMVVLKTVKALAALIGKAYFLMES